MNKTASFVVFGVLTLACIAGTVILQIHRPDATASLTKFVFQRLGLVVLAGGLGAGRNSVAGERARRDERPRRALGLDLLGGLTEATEGGRRAEANQRHALEEG